MFPGLTTKVSEAEMNAASVLYQTTDVIHIVDTTSTTVLSTITPQFGGGFGGVLVLINRTANAITSNTTGNIAATFSIPAGESLLLTYSRLTDTYYPQVD